MADTDIAHLLDQMMRRVHVGLQARSAAFDAHGVGPGGGMVLMTLAEIAPAPIHALVSQVARDKSQITRMLKALEGKGLIAREMSQADARVCVVDLTAEGLATVEVLRGAVAEVVDEILAPLEEADRVVLKGLLERVAV